MGRSERCAWAKKHRPSPKPKLGLAWPETNHSLAWLSLSRKTARHGPLIGPNFTGPLLVSSWMQSLSNQSVEKHTWTAMANWFHQQAWTHVFVTNTATEKMLKGSRHSYCWTLPPITDRKRHGQTLWPIQEFHLISCMLVARQTEVLGRQSHQQYSWPRCTEAFHKANRTGVRQHCQIQWHLLHGDINLENLESQEIRELRAIYWSWKIALADPSALSDCSVGNCRHLIEKQP